MYDVLNERYYSMTHNPSNVCMDEWTSGMGVDDVHEGGGGKITGVGWGVCVS